MKTVIKPTSYRGFSSEQLAVEYSPSSCIDDINIYIQQYIESSQQALTKALDNETVLINLNYGSNQDEILDLYIPYQKPTPNKTKLHIYIHGGYWQELSKNESSFAATNFQQHGCYFAVINYSLAPKASLTEIVAQNCRAIAWLYQNAEKLGFDQQEIYLSGSSAGAHLAIMMLATNWQQYLPSISERFCPIKGICAVSGIYDLTPIPLTYINQPLQLSEQEVNLNSPIKLNCTASCQLIFAYGEHETSEFKRQTQDFITYMENQNYQCRFNEIEERNHFDVILDLANPDSWLCQQVFQQMGLFCNEK